MAIYWNENTKLIVPWTTIQYKNGPRQTTLMNQTMFTPNLCKDPTLRYSQHLVISYLNRAPRHSRTIGGNKRLKLISKNDQNRELEESHSPQLKEGLKRHRAKEEDQRPVRRDQQDEWEDKYARRVYKEEVKQAKKPNLEGDWRTKVEFIVDCVCYVICPKSV